MEEYDLGQILNTISKDDLDGMKKIIEQNPEVKGYKLGIFPLASVAVLFDSRNVSEYLFGLYRETFVFSEHTDLDELSDKQSEYFSDEIFDGARFIEPVEVAYLLFDEKTAENVLKKTGIKTVSARSRFEKLLAKKGVHTLVKKGKDEYSLRATDQKKNKRMRAFILLSAIALVLAVIVPVTTLACLKVNVNYYDGSRLYGTEKGLGGADITIEPPEKTGYTFLGWFADKELTISASGKLPKKSGNYYAGWQINEYTVIFDVGSYEFEEDFDAVRVGKYGTKLIMPVPKLAGKLFVGWYDENGKLVSDNIYSKNVTLTPKFVDFEDNSIDNPYEITDPEQLLFLSEQSGYFVFKDGLTFGENYISSGAFTSYSLGFAGILSGENRTVYVNNCNNPIFLSIAESGIVKDLNIVVTDNIVLDEYGYDRYGVLVALNNGKIENVHINFSKKYSTSEPVDITSKVSINSVGGLVGSNTGVLQNCMTDGKLRVEIMSIYPTVNYTGGITGSNSGKVLSCSVGADIQANVWNGGIGGIVGYNIGSAEQCKTYSHIVAKGVMNTTSTDIIDSLVCQIGGIVASNMATKRNSELFVGSVSDCAFYGSVEYSTVVMSGYIGGISGYSSGNIVKCETGQNASIRILESEYLNYLGGIVGFVARRSEGEVRECVARGVVSGGDKGYSYVGGIAGESIAENGDDKLTISNSESLATISGGCYMGGISGSAVSTLITKCVFDGKIESVSRKEYTVISGGIAGGTLQSEIVSSISKGSIESKSKTYDTYNYVGGLVGECIDSAIESSVFAGILSTKSNDTSGLLFSLINLLNNNCSLSSCYAVTDGEHHAFNDYDGRVDENGKLLYHDEADETKPLLHPSDEGLVDSLQDLIDKPLQDIEIVDGEIVIKK